MRNRQKILLETGDVGFELCEHQQADLVDLTRVLLCSDLLSLKLYLSKMYLTPWKVVVCVNSSHVGISSGSSTSGFTSTSASGREASPCLEKNIENSSKAAYLRKVSGDHWRVSWSRRWAVGWWGGRGCWPDGRQCSKGRQEERGSLVITTMKQPVHLIPQAALWPREEKNHGTGKRGVKSENLASYVWEWELTSVTFRTLPQTRRGCSDPDLVRRLQNSRLVSVSVWGYVWCLNCPISDLVPVVPAGRGRRTQTRTGWWARRAPSLGPARLFGNASGNRERSSCSGPGRAGLVPPSRTRTAARSKTARVPSSGEKLAAKRDKTAQ